MKKVLSRILLLSFLFVGIFITLSLVNAQTPKEVIFDPIIHLFTDWEAGNFGPNIAKYLFFILISLFVWSLIDFSDLIPSRIVTWTASAIIGFLSVAYIAPQQIWVLLTSYNALGLTLIFFVPLIILALFTLRVASSGGAKSILFQWLIWIIYFGFLIGSFVRGILNNQINMQDSFTWIYLGAIILVAILVFFNNQIIRFLSNVEREQEAERAENITRKSVRLRKIEAGAFDDLSGARRRSRTYE